MLNHGLWTNRWLKECVQLTVREYAWRTPEIDGSWVRVDLWFSKSNLNFQGICLNVLDAEPGPFSEFAVFTFVSIPCW
jgi:hypothetical protein